jgi:hypothetical protein
MATQKMALAKNVARNTEFGTPQHEDNAVYTYPNALNFGAVTPPPMAPAPASKGIDIVAHWYNDFGLDYTSLAASEAKGWYGWHDWRWNFPTNAGNGDTTMGYDQARHPLQGFYKGDNADVLGWQCLWMAEAGINVASIGMTGNYFSSANWSNPSDKAYWVYQLFNNVPNFGALQYMLWMRYDGTNANDTQPNRDANKVQIEAQNDDVVATYAAYPGAYSYSQDGKTYAAVYIHDLESLRGVYDNFVGATASVAYLKALAVKFQSIGYDGVMVMARNGGTITATSSTLSNLRKSGALVIPADYESRYGSDASYTSSYANYAANAVFPTSGILNVVTAAKNAYPHPTGWTLAGTTPALFRKVLRRAVAHIIRNKMHRIVTIYNVSEWAEGGPGLLPNKKDGFGYLDAIRSLPVAPAPRNTLSRPGTLLGITTYRPSGSDVVFGATGASMQDVNAANLSVTFTAPESGSVVVSLNGIAYAVTDDTASVYWGLRDSGGDVLITQSLVGQGTKKARRTVDISLTGLTPKTVYTYKWAHRAGATAQDIAHAQGPNFGTSVMQVIAVD